MDKTQKKLFALCFALTFGMMFLIFSWVFMGNVFVAGTNALIVTTLISFNAYLETRNGKQR